MEINTYCPECENGIFLDRFPEKGLIHCHQCSKGRWATGTGGLNPDGSLYKCGICGGTEFYRRKDFNTKLGLWIIGLGFGLALIFHTWFLKILIAMAILDFILYWLLPEIGVCYYCESIYRGVPLPSKVVGFDLKIHDEYKFKNKTPVE